MATSQTWQSARATFDGLAVVPGAAAAKPSAGEGSADLRATSYAPSQTLEPVLPSSVPAPAQMFDRPSASIADWSREQCDSSFAWQPARQLLRALRDYNESRARRGIRATCARKLAVLRHRFWSAVSGAEIPLNAADIAGGLLLPHPNGVVVHPEAVIGPNCLLFQQVTIGSGPRPGVPTLGGAVDVGPGAKILGGVTIGDGAMIGANAVVIQDVPAGAVAVGVPAVTKRITKRPAQRVATVR